MVSSYFNWVLSIHLMAVISWMAGLFYLPRLFVYHTQIEKKEPKAYERFIFMEKRLFFQIMMPAMMVSLLTGIIMMLTPGIVDWHSFWWWGKIDGIFGMIFFHFCCFKWLYDFKNHVNSHSEKFYRIINECPTILMIIIVIMIIVRP